MDSKLEQLENNPDYNNHEEKMLNFWLSNGIYQKLLQEHKNDTETFEFTDGPPFPSSGQLHHGHITVGAIKSLVLFYQWMTGKKVSNKLGYDCHGLPIEMVCNKVLNVYTKDEVNKILASFPSN